MYSQQPPEGTTYPSQDPYQPQQQLGEMPYTSPSAYPPQEPYPQPNPYAPQQSANPYAPQQPQGPYPQQYPYMAPQITRGSSNRRARSALTYGIISIVLSLLTLFTLVGFAGVITGAFAIIYGFIGLNMAKQLPNNAGRGQAITGIVLGIVGLVLVILSFIIRSSVQGS